MLSQSFKKTDILKKFINIKVIAYGCILGLIVIAGYIAYREVGYTFLYYIPLIIDIIFSLFIGLKKLKKLDEVIPYIIGLFIMTLIIGTIYFYLKPTVFVVIHDHKTKHYSQRSLTESVLMGLLLVIWYTIFATIGSVIGVLISRKKRAPLPPPPPTRYCMWCGAIMPPNAKVCPRCGKEPPSGVNTKICPNCGAVIPRVAKFCNRCGAAQSI